VSEAADFETLLRQALTPVDPPADLAERLELTLANLAELAADELESWELAAMRDPRNWVRPAAALVVGTAAGTALVVVRVRRNAKRRPGAKGVLDQAERTVRDIAGEARRLLDVSGRLP
jgi:hypothetical protein